MKIQHEYTKKILSAFEEISQVPRPSKKEERIVKWLLDWAKSNDLVARTDKMNNLLIEVPATPGFENSETLVIQGHLDMVCEKAKDSTHNFDEDPIEFVYTEDGWLKANKTTLGADNGIAIAMAMVAATDKEIGHPKLELLFTVDEETGLTGATALEPGFVSGKQLLNVDSEDEGVFTVGCAGGEDAQLVLPFETAAPKEGTISLKLSAGGMSGGHSGVDIGLQRANAIKVLFRALHLIQKQTDIQLAAIEAGTARNAIPRDAEATVFVNAGAQAQIQALIAELGQKLKVEYAKTDPKIELSVTQGDNSLKACGVEVSRKIVNTVMVFPDGVDAMSKDIGGLVETSNNLAKITIEGGKLTILSNQRSSNMDSLEILGDRIIAIGELAGADGSKGGIYPSWKPNMDSALLARCKAVYQNHFGKEPVIEAIHAGLECGIIGAKYEGMDMISFGPTIKNPHSPDEKIEIDSIGKVWDFMVALFESYK